MADNFRVGYDGTSWLFVLDAMCPSPEEEKSFEAASPLEIRFSSIDNIIFFSLKYGGEPPIDAPFTPHWQDPAPFLLEPPTSRTGYAAQYILRPGGKTRLIGLSPEFSQALYHEVVAAFHAPFRRAKYQCAVNSVYAGFTPEQLWDNAPPEQRYVVGTKSPVAKGGVPDGISIGELAKTAEYVADAGTMCVYCVPECLRAEAEAGENPDDYAVPVPVKFLRERGFTVRGGVVYVDAPYDDALGLMIDDAYYTDEQ